MSLDPRLTCPQVADGRKRGTASTKLATGDGTSAGKLDDPEVQAVDDVNGH